MSAAGDTTRSAAPADRRTLVVRRTPWGRGALVRRAAWMTLGRLLWTCLPGLRPAVMRAFGAKVGRECRFARSVDIVIPWNLSLGDGVEVGERVILYALGPITLGDGVVIDFAGHLCAGSHDISNPAFPQTRPPIQVGAGSFIGMDAFVGPGVSLGQRCLVHPRASVHTSFGDGVELAGNPARPVNESLGQ